MPVNGLDSVERSPPVPVSGRSGLDGDCGGTVEGGDSVVTRGGDTDGVSGGATVTVSFETGHNAREISRPNERAMPLVIPITIGLIEKVLAVILLL